MKQSKTYQKSQVLQKSEKTILIYKQLGQTPLEAIRDLDIVEKVGYAGRLDPMAEGLVLLLVGDENKNKVNYENLPKEYRFECVFGIETDSLDMLGLISHVHFDDQVRLSRDEIKGTLSTFEGDVDLPYPIYSSKRVQGKPLFHWARAGKLAEIELPSKVVTISKLTLHSVKEMSGDEIAKSAVQKVHLVKGDFRQEEIIHSWEVFSKQHGSQTFLVADITASVSSGTYIRSLCREIGKSLGTSGIALSISRTKIGDWAYTR